MFAKGRTKLQQEQTPNLFGRVRMVQFGERSDRGKSQIFRGSAVRLLIIGKDYSWKIHSLRSIVY